MRERVLIFIAILAIFRGCASLTTPTGGPKDKVPPELLRSTPAKNETNFKGKTIELVFDEPVKLNNPKEEIIISPSPGKNVDIKAKGSRVTLTPDDPWKDSTTYSILFREGIQDITEGTSPDTVSGLKLAFSTGNIIDSLKIPGKIEDLLKGIPLEKITVAIYQPDTFDIFTDTANYFTRTDKKGRYQLENIKAGNYKIYAFDDKNKNLRVDSRNERYGYLSDDIVLQKDLDSVRLGLISLDARPLKILSIRNIGTITRLRFNKFVTAYTIKADSDVTHLFGGDQTEVIFWNPVTFKDSIKISLSAVDSVEYTKDSIFYIKKTDIKPIKEPFRWSMGEPVVDSETGKFSTVMTFSKPIDRINLDSLFIEVNDNLPSLDTLAKKILQTTKQLLSKPDTIKIIPRDTVPKPVIKQTPRKFNAKQDTSKLQRKDSLPKIVVKKLPRIPITKDQISIDLIRKELTVTRDIDKKIFKGEKDPTLSLVSRLGFLLSIDNDTTKAQTTPIPIIWPEDTGILLLQTDTKETSYVIELLRPDGSVLRSIQNVPKYTFKNVPPGEYQLRTIIDKNKNGKWDAGNFLKKVEPEEVVFYKTTDGKLKFPIRANWELGPLVLKF